jgi:diacylglycerol kinase family enzyme
VVGLIFLVTSLYSNVISTASLAITPITAVIVFHDKMNVVKIISTLMALLGFASYIYQTYLDHLKARDAQARDARAVASMLQRLTININVENSEFSQHPIAYLSSRNLFFSGFKSLAAAATASFRIFYFFSPTEIVN